MAAVCAAGCALLTPQRAYAAPDKTVRIGYAEMPGFIYKDDMGNYTGYACDLLGEISNYTNWNCKFVESSYSTMKEDLEKGRIDVFIPYQKTEERERYFEYSASPFCGNNASLLALPDSELYYNDFGHFNGITIGAEKGTRNGTRFVDYFAEHGCRVKLDQSYRSVSEMRSAMKSGRIDAFVSASGRGVDNCRVICSLDETLSYMLEKKGDRTLVDEFDAAMAKLSANTPLFMSRLEEKYRVPENGSYPSLTREESDYIKKQRELTVMVASQYYDAGTKDFKGSAKKMLSLLSARTGLRFKAVTAPTLEDTYSVFAKGGADLCFSFDSEYKWADGNNAWLTADYTELNGIMIHRRNDDGNIRRIAVVKGSYLEHYIKEHTNYTPVVCDSYEAALGMVGRNMVDGVVCSSFTGNYYESVPKYRTFVFSTMYEFKNKYCIAVSKSSDNILVGIIDKGVGSIPSRR